MKRYYISPMVQNPARPDIYVPKVTLTLNKPFVALTPDDFTQGWALVIVDAVDHTAAIADTDNDALPDLTLDSPLGSNWTNNVKNRLSNRGIDVSGITSQTTYRELLRRIGLTLNANFSENAFDVTT